jgi:hypothetical protein
MSPPPPGFYPAARVNTKMVDALFDEAEVRINIVAAEQNDRVAEIVLGLAVVITLLFILLLARFDFDSWISADLCEGSLLRP